MIVSDERGIQNVQSGGAPGLELRTTLVTNHWKYIAIIVLQMSSIKQKHSEDSKNDDPCFTQRNSQVHMPIKSFNDKG